MPGIPILVSTAAFAGPAEDKCTGERNSRLHGIKYLLNTWQDIFGMARSEVEVASGEEMRESVSTGVGAGASRRARRREANSVHPPAIIEYLIVGSCLHVTLA